MISTVFSIFHFQSGVFIFFMVVLTRFPSSSHSSLISKRVSSSFDFVSLSHSLTGGAHPRTAFGPDDCEVGTGAGCDISEFGTFAVAGRKALAPLASFGIYEAWPPPPVDDMGSEGVAEVGAEAGAGAVLPVAGASRVAGAAAVSADLFGVEESDAPGCAPSSLDVQQLFVGRNQFHCERDVHIHRVRLL